MAGRRQLGRTAIGIPTQPGKTRARRWLFTKKAQRSYLDAQFQPADVLVFGSESSGLPDSLLDAHPADSQLRIPTRAEVRSLNLSNAVAVASYEALRQWG